MKKKIKTDDTPQIKAYKGFDKDMKCRGFQFKEGETYNHHGLVKACESGFHSCENPLDVLNYYDLCDSRFASVSVGGKLDRHDGDSKIASATITIDAEIKLPEFIKAAVNWIMDTCKGDDSSQLAASGDSSKLAASGYSSQLAASGDSSKLAASGYSSIAMCAGIGGTAKAGENGTIVLTRWVSEENRYRVSVAYVGENGIKPDVWYTLDGDGNFKEETCQE